jgi:hypothetical protein
LLGELSGEISEVIEDEYSRGSSSIAAFKPGMSPFFIPKLLKEVKFFVFYL